MFGSFLNPSGCGLLVSKRWTKRVVVFDIDVPAIRPSGPNKKADHRLVGSNFENRKHHHFTFYCTDSDRLPAAHIERKTFSHITAYGEHG